MKINIKQIGPKGREFKESFPADSIGPIQDAIAKFAAPVDVSVELTRAEKQMVAKVKALGRLETLCGRCLKELAQDLATEFTLYFDIDSTTEFIEIGGDIREEIILGLPWQFLCSKDCKGLCVDCGANLNVKSCPHNHSVTQIKN